MLRKFLELNFLYNLVTLGFGMLVPFSYLRVFSLANVDEYYLVVGIINLAIGSVFTTYFNAILPKRVEYPANFLVMTTLGLLSLIITVLIGDKLYEINEAVLIFASYALIKVITNSILSNYKLNFDLSAVMYAEIIENLVLIVLFYSANGITITEWTTVMLLMRLLLIVSVSLFLRVSFKWTRPAISYRENIIKFATLYVGNLGGTLAGTVEKVVLLKLGDGVLSIYVLASKVIAPLNTVVGSSQNTMIFFNQSNSSETVVKRMLSYIRIIAMVAVVLFLWFLEIPIVDRYLHEFTGLLEKERVVFRQMVLISLLAVPMSTAYSVMKRYHLADGRLRFITIINIILAAIQIILIFSFGPSVFAVSYAIAASTVLIYFIMLARTATLSWWVLLDIIWLIAALLFLR